ncbi:MAG: hypothetical protein ABI548_18315 [Polyangiaceae bacterium]
MTKWSCLTLALLAGVGCAVAACGSDDDTTGGGGTSGMAAMAGKAAAGAAGKGTAAGGEGGTTGGGAGEGGSGGESTLYTRLGSHDGIAAAIGLIVTKELGDPDIASYFAPNLQVASHKPQAADIEECFTALLGHAAGGSEMYPMTTKSGFVCRGMAEAHSDLHIGSGTFDHFVMIAGGVLKDAHVSDDDITTVAGVLTGTKSTIVDNAAPANGPCIVKACEVGEAGAGGAGGSK